MTEPPAGPTTLVQVDWADPRAVALRQAMDDELMARYLDPGASEPGDDVRRALFVDPSDVRATVLVLDSAGLPLAHGALRMLRGEWEVKRIIVSGTHRARGLGRALMTELERLAWADGAERVILQTGDRQPEAVALYERLGYTRIPVYEPYVEAIPFSICFEKPRPTSL